jgi:hypothetical protein
MVTPSPRPPRMSREDYLASIRAPRPAPVVVPKPRTETTPDAEVQP